MRQRWLSAVLLCLCAAVANAADLTATALLLRDDMRINGAKEFGLLAPVNAENRWRDQQTRTVPQGVELWFPRSQAVVVRSLRFATLMNTIQEGELQAWENGAWKTVQPLKPADPLARHQVFKIELKEPVRTNGLRIWITKISWTDHESLMLADWKIEGETEGEPLFDDAGLTLSCAAEFNTFDLPASAKIAVSVKNLPGKAENFLLRCRWQTYSGFPVEQVPAEEAFTLAPGAERTFTPELAVKEQGPYRMTAELWDAQRNVLLCVKRIIVGLRDKNCFAKGEVATYRPLPGQVVPLAERIKRDGAVWEADASLQTVGQRAGEEFFAPMKQGGCEMLMNFQTYHNFEPLPGVYNFAYFDRFIDKAREHGLGLSMGLWWWDFSGPSQFWLIDTQKRNREGKSGKGWEGINSLFSQKFTQHSTRAVELLVKRYNDCPEVWMWFPHPYGSVDHDGHGLFDFHPEALAAWAQYLQKKYPQIADLNRTYGANYADWAKVPVPTPLYEGLAAKGDFAALTTVLDTRPQWTDWLDFYHGRLLDFRVGMMQTVRNLDQARGICGVNACGGVGKADETFKALKQYNAFYGDQGANLINNHFRRLVAKRYGLQLRLEDIAPVTPGRNGFDLNNAVDRCNHNAFIFSLIAPEHINYVFATRDNSPYWQRVFSNPVAKKIFKDASRSELVMRPVGYLHSFRTDVLAGKYNYGGISLYRWWLMGGISEALSRPGQMLGCYSDGNDLSDIGSLKLLIDDGSRVLARPVVDRLVKYVEEGGRLMLLSTSGEEIDGEPQAPKFELLRRLGYGDTAGLAERDPSVGILVMNGDNPVFRTTTILPLHFRSTLKVPQGGTLLGLIGKKPGAVAWKLGKGEVVLLGGLPGGQPEAVVQEVFTRWQETPADKRKPADSPWPQWRNAERELNRELAMLVADLSEWAGVQPLFEVNGDLLGCMRQAGSERMVYLFNQGPELMPVLRIPLTEGKYRVTTASLELQNATGDLGVFTAATLAAPGVALPKLGKDRYLMVRITPEP